MTLGHVKQAGFGGLKKREPPLKGGESRPMIAREKER